MKRLGYLSAAPRVSTDPNSEASGPRAHVLGVIKSFRNNGWEVYEFIVGDRFPKKVVNNSEKRLRKNIFTALLADIARTLLGLINSISAYKELSNRVDWVYERFAALQSLGWIFKRKNIPWVLETNGPFFYEAKTERKAVVLSGISRIMEVWAYRKCDVLVCVSEPLKTIVVEEAKIEPNKVIVVPNGVDTEFFDPNSYTPERLSIKFTIGFVGSLISWQGLDLLLEAISELQKEENLDISLTIIGEGPMKDKWESKSQLLSIDDKVRFVGRISRDQIPSYIKGFDVGFSGQIELKKQTMYHSPLKLYEYMAMAKPVIASSFNDARNLIEDKGTGFLFKPSDKEDLKMKIKKAYESNSLEEMGLNARREILENHSWDARIENMIPEINNILKGKG